MRKKRPEKPRTFPSQRMAALVAAGSIWFFAIPWGGSGFLWLGIGYLFILICLAVLDARWVQDSNECKAHRELDPILSLGEENPIWLEISHQGQQSLHVTLRDEPPLEFQVKSSIITTEILPGETRRACYKVTPQDRGDYLFSDLNVRYQSILGMMVRQETIRCETPVKVYPDVSQTKKHLILARENRTTLMGLRKSKLVGQGMEFERLRDYVPDDPLRTIDWKATARRGNLITREYDVVRSQNIMILLDLGRTMATRIADPDGKIGMCKADYAINASILLTHVAAQSDDRIGLFCFAQSPIAYVAPRKGMSQVSILMDSLYPLQPRTEESNYYENLALLSQKNQKRSLIFVFTDLIDPESSRALIRSMSLLIKKHLVVCVALSDYELPDLMETEPQKTGDLYVQTIANSILKERRHALAQLNRLGVVTIDAAPSDLSVATVNKYLQLKREARI